MINVCLLVAFMVGTCVVVVVLAALINRSNTRD
jgi:hypothetical protein